MEKAEGLSIKNDISHAVVMMFFMKFWILFFYEGRVREADDLQRNMETALTNLDKEIRYARANQWDRLCIETLMLKALVSDTVGETVEALDFLDQAMGLAQSLGLIRLFADEGESMANLIGQLMALGKHVEYGGILLTAIDREGKNETGTMIEQMTGREEEVIRL